MAGGSLILGRRRALGAAELAVQGRFRLHCPTMTNRSTCTMGVRARHGLFRVACVCLSLLAGGATPAAADQYTDQINAPMRNVSQDRRAELVLLPLLVKMDAPPASVNDRTRAMLMQAGYTGWGDVLAWVNAPNQRAVIDALKQVTKEDDPLKAYVFALGYGVEVSPRQLVRDRMYIELGDPPTIAAAQLLYMPKFDQMVCLIHVEATRLAADGKVSDAVDLMTSLSFLGRMMVDRPMMREAQWGLDLINNSMERVRDVIYMDLRAGRKLDVARVPAQIKRIALENSYIDLARTRVPSGDLIGVSQVIARVYRPDGSVDDRTFASTLARLGATEFPLRLFSEASRWRALQANQVDRFAAETAVRGITSDFTRRWQIDWWDRHMGTPSELHNIDKDKYAAIAAAISEQRPLLDAMQVARVEIGGTRTSLALAAQWINTGNMPTNIAMIRPRWIDKLDVDFFDASRLRGTQPRFYFTIPMTDRRGLRPGETAKAMEVEVVPQYGAPFSVPLQDDVWVLYSVGSDSQANGARRVQNTAQKVQNADYLLWPPIISLYRQNLVDLGDLK